MFDDIQDKYKMAVSQYVTYDYCETVNEYTEKLIGKLHDKKKDQQRKKYLFEEY